MKPTAATKFLCAALTAGALALSGPATAERVGVFQDWAAHAEGEGKTRVCWVYSEPVKDEGDYTRRGRIYALITHRPAENIRNQVQFTAGYTFRKGSTVEVEIGSKKFELFTNADTAWAHDKEEDTALVAAMRAGNTMIVTGTSSRGTLTKDTYSLSGVTAAHNAIGKACGID